MSLPIQISLFVLKEYPGSDRGISNTGDGVSTGWLFGQFCNGLGDADARTKASDSWNRRDSRRSAGMAVIKLHLAWMTCLLSFTLSRYKASLGLI